MTSKFIKMDDNINFNFMMFPAFLVKDERYRKISYNAKIIYMLLMDRVRLSIKNKWVDKKGRVFIIYVIKDLMKILNHSKQTIVNAMKELDDVNGVGLIRKIRINRKLPNLLFLTKITLDETNTLDFSSEVNDKSFFDDVLETIDKEVKNEKLLSNIYKLFNDYIEENTIEETNSTDETKEENSPNDKSKLATKEVIEFIKNHNDKDEVKFIGFKNYKLYYVAKSLNKTKKIE